MSELTKAEFAVAQTLLQKAKTRLQTTLQSSTADPVRLLQQYNSLQAAVQSIESFRPTKKTELNDPLEYASIIPVIGEAQVLLMDAEDQLPPSPTENKPKITSSNLPKLRLPTFDGTNPSKFPKFYHAITTILEKSNVPSEEKLMHLESALSGKAAQYIENLPITEHTYAIALSKLKNKYDKPDLIISTLYEEIRTMPPADESTTSLRQALDKLENDLQALELRGEDLDTNKYLRNIVVGKFPSSIIYLLTATHGKLDLQKLRKTLENLISEREDISVIPEIPPPKSAPQHESPKPVTAALITGQQFEKPKAEKKKEQDQPKTDSKIQCVFCEKAHYSDLCTTHKTTEERKKQLRNTCYLCLKKGHSQKDCSSQKPCYYCKAVKRHHSALCPKKFGFYAAPKPETATPTPTAGTSNNPTGVFLTRSKGGTYLTSVGTVSNPSKQYRIPLRILLDCGSPNTFITQKAANLLQLTQENGQLVDIGGFNNQVTKDLPSAEVKFQIHFPDSSAFDVDGNTTPAIAERVHPPNVAEFRKQFPQYSHLQFANPGTNDNIDVLIGSNYAFKILKMNGIIDVDEHTQIIDSKFGHFIVGKDPTRPQEITPTLLTTTAALDRLSSLDTIGINEQPRSEIQEETEALEQFYENIKFENDRYVVQWPWKQFPPDLPSNLGLAIGQLRSLVKQYFQPSTNIFQMYADVIQQQIEDGIVEEIPYDQKSEKVHYVPHHPVIKPHKSTPLRIVYNGSARMKGSRSLNECIHKGKNLLADLTALLLRFRLNKIAMCADIAKAFHQLQIAESDRDYVRFLFVKDPTAPVTNDNLRLFRFLRVAFGIVASPFLLLATINYHLGQQDSPYKHLLARDIYADNLITTAETVEAAKQLHQDAVHIFQKCSMNLRSWNSNNDDFNKSLPLNLRDTNRSMSILGITWNTQTDTLIIPSPPPLDPDTQLTLRLVLAQSAKIYDVIGFWTPVTIRAKMLMQEIRVKKFVWDTPLPGDIVEKWREIERDYQKLNETPIPRRITETSFLLSNSTELHVFADASKLAYAAVVYLRTVENEHIVTKLVFSKARTPKYNAEYTIPQLELLAALIGARASKYVAEALNLPATSPRYLWSDSRCVINWLNTKKILSTFIQNRVKEIKKIPNIQFRHVPGEMNPADIPSRGSTVDEIMNPASIYFNGPPFLQLNQSHWPQQPPILQDSPSGTCKNPIAAVLHIKINEQPPLTIDIKKFSSLKRLLGVTVRIRHFIGKFQISKRRNLFQNATENTIRTALQLWLKHEQQLHFDTILNDLRHKKTSNTIRQLNLHERENLLRCQHRFPTEQQDLILLPSTKVSHLTTLIILQHHVNNHHSGTAHTLTAIRRRYWIPKGRKEVFHTLKKCAPCIRFTSRPFRQPDLASYHTFQLQKPDHPFSAIGLDELGPLYTVANLIDGKSVACKRWVLLITCLHTRAIHLELLLKNNVEEFALAYRNFRARRGPTTVIYADAASQHETFKTACEKLYPNEITWKINPGQSPWSGGAYERLVAITKQALHRTFRNTILTDRHLSIILEEIAATINSRPITYVSDELDLPPLTPNDLLNVRYETNGSVPQSTNSDTIVQQHVIHMWRQSNEILNQFWKTWSDSYLQQLRERLESYKFRKAVTTTEPRIDQIVLLREPNTKRSNWRMGKILQLRDSHDGGIRSAVIKLKSGEKIVRPVQNLYPLEVDPMTDRSTCVQNDEPPPMPTSQSHDDDDEIVEIECEVIEET